MVEVIWKSKKFGTVFQYLIQGTLMKFSINYNTVNSWQSAKFGITGTGETPADNLHIGRYKLNLTQKYVQTQLYSPEGLYCSVWGSPQN